MDLILNSGSNSSYFLIMAKLEADRLLDTVKSVAVRHLKDFFIRDRFESEIRFFINGNLRAIENAKTDNERKEFLRNIKQETENLKEQDSQLRHGMAKIHTSITAKHEKGGWSYVVDGISIVSGTLQIVGGVAVVFASTPGNITGMAFGSMLVLHGTNAIHEGIVNIVESRDDTVGFMKEGYIAIAEFAGFQTRAGATAFSVMDLTLSGYGLARLTLKSSAWRLFHYIPSDYVRGLKQMSKADLILEMYNDSMALKSINDNQ